VRAWAGRRRQRRRWQAQADRTTALPHALVPRTPAPALAGAAAAAPCPLAAARPRTLVVRHGASAGVSARRRAAVRAAARVARRADAARYAGGVPGAAAAPPPARGDMGRAGPWYLWRMEEARGVAAGDLGSASAAAKMVGGRS
jgi:hypothetical protein